MINALAYVVISTPHLGAWREFAQRVVGLQADDIMPNKVVRLRMDEKVQRLLLQPAEEKPSLTMGFEVEDATSMEKVAARLRSAGFSPVPATPQEIEQRGLQGMFHFADPDGNGVEVAWGLEDADSKFRPGRPIGGFRTGSLGIGHVALKTGDYAGMCTFYRDVLGFQLSDYVTAPFSVEFLHVNPRHHTLGLADTGTGPGVYHLMLEYNEWDDVGRAHDIALERDATFIGVTLGRHTNDYVTSFYLRSPDDWMLELGWGGRLIEQPWRVEELPGLSLWGHDRSWLPPAKREEAKAQTRSLSERGIRAPVTPPGAGDGGSQR